MNVKTTIIEEVVYKQLIWFDHVKIMPDKSLPKAHMEWIPQKREKEEDREESDRMT